MGWSFGLQGDWNKYGNFNRYTFLLRHCGRGHALQRASRGGSYNNEKKVDSKYRFHRWNNLTFKGKNRNASLNFFLLLSWSPKKTKKKEKHDRKKVLFHDKKCLGLLCTNFKMVPILCPRVPFLKRSAIKYYLLVLSWYSLTNFLSLQKSNNFCQKIKCALFYELIYFVKSRPTTFFHGKKVN